MRTESESSRIVDKVKPVREHHQFSPDQLSHFEYAQVVRPKRVDKQLVRIKKELERFEGIVDNLKMFLRMKPKERKLVSGIIDMWLDKIK